jgi:hypothetical protein
MSEPLPPPPAPIRRGGTGVGFAVVGTIVGAFVFAIAWFIAKWATNTCPDDLVTASDGDFAFARTLIVGAALAWAVIPALGYRHATKHDRPALGFAIAAVLIVALGTALAITLSSSEVCVL